MVLRLVGVLSGHDGGEHQLQQGAMLWARDLLEPRVDPAHGLPGMPMFALSAPGEPRRGQGIPPARLNNEPGSPKVSEMAVETPAGQRTNKGSDGGGLRAEVLEDGPINRAQRSHAHRRNAPTGSCLARQFRVPGFEGDVG